MLPGEFFPYCVPQDHPQLTQISTPAVAPGWEQKKQLSLLLPVILEEKWGALIKPRSDNYLDSGASHRSADFTTP